jgi:hypothetical protein
MWFHERITLRCMSAQMAEFVADVSGETAVEQPGDVRSALSPTSSHLSVQPTRTDVGRRGMPVYQLISTTKIDVAEHQSTLRRRTPNPP